MKSIHLNERELKQLVKEAVSEALEESRDNIYEIVAEVIEDFMFSQIQREGEEIEMDPKRRPPIFAVTEGKA